MYSLKLVTEKNREYCFEDISLESRTYEQDGAAVTIQKQGRASRIQVRVKDDRVKHVSHIYSTALRNFHQVIVPDCGRNFIAMEHTVYFWTKNYASRVNDVKSPLYILCGQDHCASLCFGVIGKDYERDFKSVEPHGGRALSLYKRELTLQISGTIPEEYRTEPYEEGIYLMDQPENTGIPWTEALREFHEIRQGWEGIVLPYTKASMYPMWCSWTDWDSAKVNEQVVGKNVEQGLTLGIQNFIIDDGWFGLGLDCDQKLKLNIGDWESDPEKFPNLPGFIRELRSKGARLIIWCAPHAVGDMANIREDRLKHLMTDENHKPVYTSNGFNALCLRNPEAREIMADICVRLARDYDTDGAKYDLYNCIPDVCCCSHDHNHDTDSMVIALQKTMELIWQKVRAEKPDYIVELKQNYGGSRLASCGTMMRAGDTPYCPEGNFLRTAYIQSYTPYAANDYQTINNHDSLESAAKVIIKMIAVGIPTYSMDLPALENDKKTLIRYLNNWYIEQIVEKERYKRTAMDGELSTWMISDMTENLYFAVNNAREITVENKDFQLLNGSMYPEIFLRTTAPSLYQLQFYDYTGTLIEEKDDVSLEAPMRIRQPVMLIKGICKS